MSLIFCLLDCFAVYSTAVTGVCYVRPIKTIWVAAGTAEAAMYDPKSGENVSQWCNSLFAYWQLKVTKHDILNGFVKQEKFKRRFRVTLNLQNLRWHFC